MFVDILRVSSLKVTYQETLLLQDFLLLRFRCNVVILLAKNTFFMTLLTGLTLYFLRDQIPKRLLSSGQKKLYK